MAEKIGETSITEQERETIRIASSTLSALESALASWELSKDKPEELKEKFARYLKFRDALAAWLTLMLRSRDNGDPFEMRKTRLEMFVKLCREYREGYDGR
ncbi:MAG TPA: hypothetical protein VLD37_04100 [Candidatus Bilamarchaeum sp.]|nr:hypothetical protein [Candidatus Bilamarchaeum sp.]